MTTQTERKMTQRGNFNEVFWDIQKEPAIEGVFEGFLEKTIDNEKRNFAVIRIDGKEKPYLCGGRDLLNKLQESDRGKFVQVKFLEKDHFTPKGTKKKVPINRFSVSVEE